MKKFFNKDKENIELSRINTNQIAFSIGTSEGKTKSVCFSFEEAREISGYLQSLEHEVMTGQSEPDHQDTPNGTDTDYRRGYHQGYNRAVLDVKEHGFQLAEKTEDLVSQWRRKKPLNDRNFYPPEIRGGKIVVPESSLS